MTEGVLEAEGFSRDARHVAAVDNWFTDLYHTISAEKMPYSGHASVFWERALTFAVTTEDWPNDVIGAATRLHFDNWPNSLGGAPNPTLYDSRGETAEWDRLRRAVWTLAQEARDRNDPEMLLQVIGISLHPLQDFYTHSNWAESQSGHGFVGSDGPGWSERGFGSFPTWFDVPGADREAAKIYSDHSPNHRLHGNWDQDGSTKLLTGMAKDNPGRPGYMKAAVTGYYATWQWVEAIRSWVHDQAFWERAMHYRATDYAGLNDDLTAMHDIMRESGQWEGQGEPFKGESPGPGGSLIDLRQAVQAYFQGTFRLNPRSRYRARFERLVKRVAEPNPTGELGPVPSSQPLQAATKVVVLKIPHIRSQGHLGLGDPWPDKADMFADVNINGQDMTSAVINDKDEFSFPKPNAPFTFFKVVPAAPNQGEPVESIQVTVRTANVRWAGTDDDVFLRLGNSFRFPLDKELYNDFEQGDLDTYSVPIDDATRRGMTVGDITRISLEKSPDGLFGGGWKVGGIAGLQVNGQTIYSNHHIDTWLEDNHRVWTARDFAPRDPHSSQIPVWIDLRENDYLYGRDDEGDINPYDHRDNVLIGYAPGATVEGKTAGGGRLGGRVSCCGDEAEISYRLETLTPELMNTGGVTTVQRTEEGLPDLVITKFSIKGVTVENVGRGKAGPFRVNVGDRTVQFAGLAAGSSEARDLTLNPCTGGIRIATVDDLNQVAELDEENNIREQESVGEIIC